MTEKGAELGNFLLERHMAIETFLKNLYITENVLTDTERIEHNISDETLQKFILFNRFVKDSPQFASQFADYVKDSKK